MRAAEGVHPMIKIIIEREIAEGMAHYYDCSLKRAMLKLNQAEGCLGGETLTDAKNPQRRITISTWRSIQDWEAWTESADRQRLLLEINPLLAQSERISVLQQAA